MAECNNTSCALKQKLRRLFKLVRNSRAQAEMKCSINVKHA